MIGSAPRGGAMHLAEARRVACITVLSALAGCSGAPEPDASGPVAGWPVYAADLGGTRHSPLTQVGPATYADREAVWTYRSRRRLDGKTSLAPSAFQNTPILFGDSLYLCTPKNRVIALDPETGEERWSYDPRANLEGIYTLNCRGVSSWTDTRALPGAACARRIFTGTLDARLIALDAETGQPCEGFGQGGVVDLREGIGDIAPGEYGVTSPPLVLGDRVITGSMVLDDRRADSPGGVVRAYSARTGQQLWAWDPVPPQTPRMVEGELRYARGTTNAWSVLSGDPALNLVYVPTGNTSPDYYGGHRQGLDYYSSSAVALDADSGAVVWHFQTVHHDIWDYDVAAQPVLFDFPGPDAPIPAVGVGTKMGHLFVLDRRTGAPLLPVEERPVPQGAAEGEYLAPTQPFPVKPPPLHPETLTPDDAWGFSFWDRGRCRELIEQAKFRGTFTPPTVEAGIQYPGMVGGINWGSFSIDPERRTLVVNTQRIATLIRLIPRATYDAMVAEKGEAKYGYEPMAGTPYALERRPLLSPLGAPCNPPPWGTL